MKMKLPVLSISFLLFVFPAFAGGLQEDQKRAKDLGIPFNGTSGKWNAITDVPGVEVGFSTLIRGTGKWKAGEGPVRTGVTIVLPKGKTQGSYFVGHFVFNGDGEMTGIPSPSARLDSGARRRSQRRRGPRSGQRVL